MNDQIQYGLTGLPTSQPTLVGQGRRRVADPARFRVGHASGAWIVSAVFGLALAVVVVTGQRLPGTSVLLLGAAWVGLMLALTLPSRAQRAGTELANRRARFRHAINAVGDSPTRDHLEGLLTLAADLGLRDEEIADDLARVRASLAALSLFEEIASGRLPIVPNPLAPDACHFVAPARLGRRRADQYGQLLLTTDWLMFTGAATLSIAWTQVDEVLRAGESLMVTAADRRALRFAFTTVEDAARAGVIAAHLRELREVDASVGYGASLFTI